MTTHGSTTTTNPQSNENIVNQQVDLNRYGWYKTSTELKPTQVRL